MQSFFFIDKRIWWQTIGFAWFFCFMVYLNLLGLGAFVSEVTVLCGILWSLMVWKRFHVSIIVLALLLSALLKRRKFPVFSFSYNGDAPSLLTDKATPSYLVTYTLLLKWLAALFSPFSLANRDTCTNKRMPRIDVGQGREFPYFSSVTFNDIIIILCANNMSFSRDQNVSALPQSPVCSSDFMNSFPSQVRLF